MSIRVYFDVFVHFPGQSFPNLIDFQNPNPLKRINIIQIIIYKIIYSILYNLEIKYLQKHSRVLRKNITDYYYYTITNNIPLQLLVFWILYVSANRWIVDEIGWHPFDQRIVSKIIFDKFG